MAADRKALPGHVPAAVSHLLPVGRLNASNRIDLAIGLPLRNREALTNLLQQLYDPTSPNFHHYLTPEQFTEKFGPTETDYQTVLRFISTNGLTVVGAYSHRELVDVSATVADIEKAFHVNLLTYRHPTEQREFYAPDIEPSVDSNVPIQTLDGLNNYYRPYPGARKQTIRSSSPANGTGPLNTYRGKDFRNAYAPGVTLTGAGQYVGLVEFDGYFQSDITNYESQAGLPNVPFTIIKLPGSSGFPDNNTNYISEVSLDIEMVISMSPGLSSLYVFEGSSFDSEAGSIVTNSQIKQISSSWFGFGFDSTGDGFLQQMAAQGQTFFQASGDGDAYTQQITRPGDDLYATTVGGTALTMDVTSSNYVSETVWNSGFQSPGWFGNGAYTNGSTVGGYWGSGGGISTNSIPGWQQGVNLTAVGGSTTKRNIPDVALTAVNIWVNYFNGLSGGFEGTSCAAPLWAGFAALVNQQAAADGKPPIGFINPALYAIGEGQNYNSSFHDIVTGNDTWPGSTTAFNSATGYDLCTGWGSPNGQKMINELENYTGPIFVNFNYIGATQNGAYNTPYPTLAQATNAVPTRGTIIFETAGSSPSSMTISKPMTITSMGGAVSIGH
ncbi:MAG TPA: S53 family peptidase [Verrucomicrobiae bacterium]|nr:S53 family peptidase [Verrucomicrobiae bacterium]